MRIFIYFISESFLSELLLSCARARGERGLGIFETAYVRARLCLVNLSICFKIEDDTYASFVIFRSQTDVETPPPPPFNKALAS